jgi:plastocyanin
MRLARLVVTAVAMLSAVASVDGASTSRRDRFRGVDRLAPNPSRKGVAMKKLAVLFSVLALAAFGFAACGDDDDDDTADTAPTEETTAGDGGGGGATVDVSADPGGDLAFEQASLEAPAGAVTFNFTNDASIPHDFVIEDADGNEVAGTEEITGDSTTLDTELEAGEYTFYCSVDAHREAGMEGPLTAQ